MKSREVFYQTMAAWEELLYSVSEPDHFDFSEFDPASEFMYSMFRKAFSADIINEIEMLVGMNYIGEITLRLVNEYYNYDYYKQFADDLALVPDGVVYVGKDGEYDAARTSP